MEFLKISNDKLRVSLSYDDIVKLNLLNYDNFDIESLIDIIVLAAEYECDFYMDKNKYLVEVKLNSNKGIVVYLTKHFESEQESIVYEFTDFFDIAAVSKNLKSDYKGISKIYSYNSVYYLILNPDINVNIKKVEAHLKEFGKKSKINLLNLYEYGNIIKDNNAMEFVSNL